MANTSLCLTVAVWPFTCETTHRGSGSVHWFSARHQSYSAPTEPVLLVRRGTRFWSTRCRPPESLPVGKGCELVSRLGIGLWDTGQTGGRLPSARGRGSVYSTALPAS